MTGSKATIHAPSEAWAQQTAAMLSESRLGESCAISIPEMPGQWLVEIYSPELLQPDAIRAALSEGGAEHLTRAPEIEVLPEEDWVTLTQQGLPPVVAGKFTVHGSHDRERVRPSRFAIEIDAGRAFGTAHHGTTRGCLLAIDRLSRRGMPVRRALDLGTGSGVLAIAIARSFHAKIEAVDFDPIAIEVAKENCKINGALEHVSLAVGNGLKPASAYDAPYDLITANILATPLIRLAGRLRKLLRPGGRVILSGLLNEQSREVLGAYLARDFALETRISLEGWMTLILHRKS